MGDYWDGIVRESTATLDGTKMTLDFPAAGPLFGPLKYELPFEVRVKRGDRIEFAYLGSFPTEQIRHEDYLRASIFISGSEGPPFMTYNAADMRLLTRLRERERATVTA